MHVKAVFKLKYNYDLIFPKISRHIYIKWVHRKRTLKSQQYQALF